MTDLAATIRANAEALRRLHARIGETVRHRSRSPADRDEWSKACTEFHQACADLSYPGGAEHWNAFLDRAPEEVEAAITFLEVDPWFFRSGYIKEIIWTRLKQTPLYPASLERLEALALAYLSKRIYREFWTMVRFVRARGTSTFWRQVAELARTDQTTIGSRAGWLLLAQQNLPVKEPLIKSREPRCESESSAARRGPQGIAGSLAKDRNDAADDSGRNPSGRG